MGRLQKIKRELVLEANKRLLNEQWVSNKGWECQELTLNVYGIPVRCNSIDVVGDGNYSNVYPLATAPYYKTRQDCQTDTNNCCGISWQYWCLGSAANIGPHPNGTLGYEQGGVHHGCILSVTQPTSTAAGPYTSQSGCEHTFECGGPLSWGYDCIIDSNGDGECVKSTDPLTQGQWPNSSQCYANCKPWNCGASQEYEDGTKKHRGCIQVAPERNHFSDPGFMKLADCQTHPDCNPRYNCEKMIGVGDRTNTAGEGGITRCVENPNGEYSSVMDCQKRCGHTTNPSGENEQMMTPPESPTDR